MARDFPFTTHDYSTGGRDVKATNSINLLMQAGEYVPYEYPENMFWGGVSGKVDIAKGRTMELEFSEDGEQLIAKVRQLEQAPYNYVYTSKADAGSRSYNRYPQNTNGTIFVDWFCERPDDEGGMREIGVAEYFNNNIFDDTAFIDDIRISQIAVSYAVHYIDITGMESGIRYTVSVNRFGSIGEFINAYNQNHNLRAVGVSMNAVDVGIRDYNTDVYSANTFGAMTVNTMFSRYQHGAVYDGNNGIKSGAFSYASANFHEDIPDSEYWKGVSRYLRYNIPDSNEKTNTGVITPYGYISDYDMNVRPMFDSGRPYGGAYYFMINDDKTGGIYGIGGGSGYSAEIALAPMTLMTPEQVLQLCASFGMAFILGTWAQGVSVALDSDAVYGPYLNNHVYEGKYSHGEDNVVNPFFGVEKTSDSDYEPEEEGPAGGGGYEDGEDNPDDKTFADEGDVPEGDPSIFNAPQAFCKYYAMTDSTITEMGKNLWIGLQSVNLGNFQEGFFTNFRAMKIPKPEDYNLDFTLSDVIDYFVKLQWFPFSTLPYGLIETHGITVGTGSKPIPIEAEGTKQLMNTSIKVTLGSCAVPAAQDITDIEPYVSCSVYVPYCGTVEIPYSQVQGRVITATACIDLVTGDMVSVLRCTSKDPKNEDISFPVATLTGKCGFDLTMSGSNFSTQALGAMISGIRNQMNLGNKMINALTGMGSSAAGKDIKGTLTGAINSGIDIATESVNQSLAYPSVMGTSPISVGSATGTACLLLPQEPYLQIVHHNTIRPNMYGETYGRPAFIDATISQCTGFVVAQNPKLSLEGAMAEEIEEIRSLLASGVYV